MIALARGFGGAPLSRANIVRLAYLDEAGISNIKHEPHLVVAGAIIYPDRDWIPLERHLRSLGHECFGDQVPSGFFFHSMELWHGNGFFPRAEWPLKRRLEILKQLVQVPGQFKIPLAVGYVNRKNFLSEFLKTRPDISPSDVRDAAHAWAFMQAAQAVDNWMKNHAPDEVVMLIGEETGKIQKALKLLQALLRSDQSNIIQQAYFKSHRIVDTIHFADKRSSILLQLADVAAFFIRRRLAGKADAEEFYRELEPHITFQSGKQFSAIKPIAPARRLSSRERATRQSRWSPL